MASFSERDIDDARRRVREMQARADSYVSEEKPSAAPEPAVSQTKNNQQTNDAADPKEDSSMMILILIMLLSQEKADRKLLLALLYLLF